MDILKRSLAPLTDPAWRLLDEEAARILRASLTGRRVVDVVGPLGLETAAVGLGRLDISADEPVAGLRYGINRALPLVELRASFEMGIWELDNAARGAFDVDLAPLSQAAQRLAEFEERAIYEGFAPGQIDGLRRAMVHEPVPLGKDGAAYPEAVARAMTRLRQAGVDGPYALVLSGENYESLASICQGCKPLKHVQKLIGGPVIAGAFVSGGFLLSTRGGDFQLVLGQDASLGWETTPASGKVRLFLMQSFTFRVLDPRAVFAFGT